MKRPLSLMGDISENMAVSMLIVLPVMFLTFTELNFVDSTLHFSLL